MGARDEFEQWKKKESTQRLRLQEIRVNPNARETRKQYIWFFSGDRGRQEYTAGAAIVIRSSFLQYIADIETVNDRLIYITCRGTLPTFIIITYMPLQIDHTKKKHKHMKTDRQS